MKHNPCVENCVHVTCQRSPCVFQISDNMDDSTLPAWTLAPCKEIPGLPYHTWTQPQDYALMSRYKQACQAAYKHGIFSCVHPDCVLDLENAQLLCNNKHSEPTKVYFRDHWRSYHMAVECRMLLACPLFGDNGNSGRCGRVFQNATQLTKHLRLPVRAGGHGLRSDVENTINALRLIWQQQDPTNRTLYFESLKTSGYSPTDLTPFLLKQKEVMSVLSRLSLLYKLAENLQQPSTVKATPSSGPMVSRVLTAMMLLI